MTPLLAATLAWAAGLLAGLRFAPLAPLWVRGAVVAATALLVAAALVRHRGAARAALLAFGCAGTIVGGLRATSLRDHCLTRLLDGDALAMTGVPRALPTEGSAVPFTTTRLVSASDATCAGAVRVRAHARHTAALDSASRGRTGALHVHGRWLTFPHHGGWPRPAHFAGVVVIDSLTPAAHADVATPSTGPLDRFRASQQARLRELLPARWPLAEALLLAQKAGLSQETRARWVAAGLVHLLAISGMHVGLITGGVLLLCTMLGLPARRARRIALLLTALYVLFLGAPTAALRALLQATLLLASLELQRPAEPFTLLATAGLLITALDPMAVLDPGFQLSFAGMVGLIGWRRPIGDLLPRRLPRYVRDGIAAGIAASALTTPIAALHFGQAAWIGIPGSLIAVPLLAVAIAGILLALLLSLVAGTTGVHTAFADLPLRALDTFAELCARVPAGHGYVPASTIYTLLALAAATILLRALLRGTPRLAPPSHAADEVHERFARDRRMTRLRLAAGVAALLAIVAWAPLLRPADDRIAIHAIDVGQGDAFAIRTPRGRWILVDCGPRTPRSDAGRDRVVPFLLRHGARRIDVLILTHPDADHIGGAAAILDAFDVRLVIDPGMPAGKDIFIDLLAAARTTRQRWVAGREGIRFDVDGVSFTMLFPLTHIDTDAVANDNSVVFRLEFGSFAALFTGDAPASVEELLVSRHGASLAAPLLKVGHHGSTTSTGDVLLRTLRPQIALVSAGRRNRYGHPAPAVIERLRQHDVRVLRTDVLGNITVRAHRSGAVEVLAR